MVGIQSNVIRIIMPLAFLWLMLMGCAPPEANTLLVTPESLIATSTDSLAPFSVTALDGEGHEMEDVNLRWTSSMPDVVAIDEKGQMTPIRSGTTMITVSAGKALTEIPVTVTLYSQIALASREISMMMGESRPLIAELLDEAGKKLPGQVTWQIADPSICEITPDGELVARMAGQTTATASFRDLSEVVTVMVNALTEPTAMIPLPVVP